MSSPRNGIFALALLSLLPLLAAEAQPRQPETKLQVEIGIDSLERRVYRPRFLFSFPIRSWTLDAVIDYQQRVGGGQKGPIDYWLDLALRRPLADSWQFEARINHLCRHETSSYQGTVFNLNEVLAKVWVGSDMVRAGFGGGFYTGGNAGYRSLLSGNLEIASLFSSEIGFCGQVTWTDFRHLLHEAEIYFPLSPGLDLFVRHARPYNFPDTGYIGMRIKSGAETETVLHGGNVLAGVFPDYDRYKLTVTGDFSFDFFPRADRRVILAVDFYGPILAGPAFLGNFWPDRMLYDIWLQYEKKLGQSLYLAWYGKYTTDMPCDKDLPFDSDLSTGLALRNQPDFERLQHSLRFEAMAGLSFKHDFDALVKAGISTAPGRQAVFGLNGYLRANRDQSTFDLRAFVEFGRGVAIRPFIGLDRVTLFSYEPLRWSKFIYGAQLFKWF